jgi:hypothetical protein
LARSTRRTGSALDELRKASADTTVLLNSITKTSEGISERTSEVLFGSLGGLLGFSAGYVLSLVIPAILLAVAAPVTSAIGVLTAVLVARGPRRFRLEKVIRTNRIAADEILNRIQSLPRNTPSEVKARLWDAYNALTGGLETTTLQALQTERSSTRPLLPPPTDQLQLPPPTVDR